ncbi:MAG: CoA-binding protein [Gemmatimonadetes bacterium]|nr:CoA-binding protein [Gemmatimonadota bacterium]
MTDRPASLDVLFRPSSIAVIGASRRKGTIGYQIIDNLLRHGFGGVVHPVNPSAASIHGVRAYPDVGSVPGGVDLAVIVVPKERVLHVVEDCGAAGVGAIVVISAGFKEVGGAGVALENELVSRVRHHGMRLVGPNCMGLLNTDPEVAMNATFAPNMPPSGHMSFLSQSGALGVTILDYAVEYGIGIRHFVSVGNKADVTGNDLLEYWEGDAGTRVVLMYLESFGDPQHFTRIARRVTRSKPVVVVKSGRTRAGARAASSHTGALAGADDATDALLEQCGVLRVDSVEELFDVAMAFEGQPVPRGNRVAIVTNAGGPGIIIADACESAGLEVASLTDDTRRRLQTLLPPEASVRNPVDMIASATGEQYQDVLDTVLDDPGVDAAIAAFVPPLGIRQIDVAAHIVAARRGGHDDKPLLAVLMGKDGLPEGKARLQAAGVPAYIFPESAARALAAMHRYRRWLERPMVEPDRFEADEGRVRALLARAREEGREGLLEHEALGALAAYGIPVVEHRVVPGVDEAVAAAEAIGFPVVVKAISPEIVHKTDVGGVAVDLRTAHDVRQAATAIVEAVANVPDARLTGLLVERFEQGGRETIVGVSPDPTFGPVVMFGLGGVYVEALSDVTFRLQPVSAQDAREMVAGIRGRALLESLRGEPAADHGALVSVIQRVSQLVGDHPVIRELDINPLLARADGALALDAHIRF